ncbi:MAG: PqqD family protein [Clostridia bacterium]|nr:PqqD family protein [Clostridia bacterium]
MKLRYEFTIMDMGEEFAAVPVGEGAEEFQGALRLNESSVEILNLLREETSPEKVHKALKQKYPESTDQEIGEMLAPFLNKLIREGLLIAP